MESRAEIPPSPDEKLYWTNTQAQVGTADLLLHSSEDTALAALTHGMWQLLSPVPCPTPGRSLWRNSSLRALVKLAPP